jgi:hypothetical protein
MKGRPVVARAIAQNALGRLEQTGDNAGVDGTVVLLAAAAEAYATGVSWLSRPLGAPARYCTGGSDWRISASTGFGGNATVRITAWRCPHGQSRRCSRF